jgi:hypothetical protein
LSLKPVVVIALLVVSVAFHETADAFAARPSMTAEAPTKTFDRRFLTRHPPKT